MEAETTFGRWLRVRRRALDLTQEEVAQQVGCSVITVRKIEADERRPSKEIAARLAHVLRIPAPEHLAFITFAREPRTDGQVSASTSQLPPSQPLIHTPPSKIPTPLTSLIGREQDVAAARNYMLRPDARLLTLLGPPGIGKTRLSIQIATDLTPAFADGVVFVALAAIRDPALVIPTIAQTLGLKEQGGQSLFAGLTARLREKEMLLALDNFEQVLDAAPFVAELLGACPQLKILATSRAPLHLRGEWQFPVPPLMLPNLAQLPAVEELAAIPAVAVFVERAQAVNPAFALTETNAATIAAICTRLDGQPLAIELAAARIKLLPPQELLGRLDPRLALLTAGPRDLPARHRTLRAAIGWSYDLLDPDEQTLLARLAVFVGGCTLDAAEAVCQGSGVRDQALGTHPLALDPRSLICHLQTLVDNSLVVQQEQADGTARFTMLETIREFAQERLIERGEAEALNRGHAAYYLELGEAIEPHLRGPQQVAWLERLEAEHNNFRAALSWALEQHEMELALRLSGALTRFWGLHSHRQEGQTWLLAALEQSRALAQERRTPAHKAARAKALLGASNLLSDNRTAQMQAEECLALYQELGDGQGSAYALHTLGVLARYAGDLVQAAALHEQCLSLSAEFDDLVGVYISVYNLAEIAHTRGDDKQAGILHEWSLRLKRQHGDTWSIAWSLVSLGQLAERAGDLDRARTLYAESLELRWELRDKKGVAESLSAVAGVMLDAELAVRCFSVVEALLEELGVALSPLIRAAYERRLAALRAELGAAKFDAAWNTGRTQPLEQMIAACLPP